MVITSIAPWVPFLPNVSAVRTFRVLRPLKSLNAVPELQVTVDHPAALPTSTACLHALGPGLRSLPKRILLTQPQPLKAIVKGILKCVAGILDVGVVLLFIFTIFGIAVSWGACA